MKWTLFACQSWREDEPPGRDYVWFPCFDKGDGWMPSLEVWFKTEEECQDFIDELLYDLRNPDEV